MTEREAIKELEMQRTFTYGSDAKILGMAINALEKQEKIKEVFTRYAFSGNELDVLNDCISALSEIKAILKE